MTALLWLTVASAGALGAVLRALVSDAVQARWHRTGAGTLLVNLLGAFALGAWMGGAAHLDDTWLWVVGTGFLGAFTTFSTWMVVLLERWHGGERRAALIEGALTLSAGVAVTALGGWLALLALG